jgi:putative tricarboxylic transport membrane protein
MTSTAGNAWRPQRAVEIVAGTPPGGGLDRAARVLLAAIEANRLLDVPARVNNVAGDGARKCWTYLDQRAGDPHVLCISSVNLTTDHLLGVSAFDHARAFTPIAILYTEYIAFVSRIDSPVKSAGGLLERLGADAGSLTVALSTSLGNPNHIALAKVVRSAGGDPSAPKLRVFDSALDAAADVMAGNADIGAITAASAVQELGEGKLRALAVSAPQPLAGLYAQVPTWSELSVDCVIGSWRGVTAPRAITPGQVVFWDHTLTAAIATNEWKAELDRLYWTDTYIGSAKLREYLQRERSDMEIILKDLGLLEE